MSASGVIEFNPSTDIEMLYVRLQKIWSSKSPGRSVALQDPMGQFHQETPPEPCLLIYKNIETIAYKAIEGLVKDVYEHFPELQTGDNRGSDGGAIREQALPNPRQKAWRCYFDYYFYSPEDRRDFMELIECILENAQGDIHYYRDPNAISPCGVLDPDPLEEVPIAIQELGDYEPSMSDYSHRYVIHKE